MEEQKKIFEYIKNSCRDVVKEAERLYDQGYPKAGIIGILMGNLNGLAHWAEYGIKLCERDKTTTCGSKLPED